MSINREALDFCAEDIERRSYIRANSPDNEFDLRPSLANHVVNSRQNLMPLYFEDSVVAVYLRVRPFSEIELKRGEDQGCMTLGSDNVLLHAPNSSNTYKNFCGRGDPPVTQFSFTQVFDTNTTQEDFYSMAAKEMVNKFTQGENCCLLCHGVTGSGKTFTIQGPSDNPGIVPRVLKDMMSNFGDRMMWSPVCKPLHHSGVGFMSPTQIGTELKIRDRLLSKGDSLGESGLSSMSSSCASLNDVMETVELNTQSAPESHESNCILWVSFYEIYNEMVFDLLAPDLQNNRKNNLKLGEDKKGTFVKGLTEVWVQTAEEALTLLAVGKKNLRFGATKMNSTSSRSHGIFTIKIIYVDAKDNTKVRGFNRLTLCDLAGTERSRKTGILGDNKETGNINNSLSTLSRCIEMVRINQKRDALNQLPPPFRNSKLTRLLQDYLSGRGFIRMIINVSPCASSFDETLHVLKLSAVAKQVQSRPTDSNISNVISVCDYATTSRQTMEWENVMDESSLMDISSVRPESPDLPLQQMRQSSVDMRDLLIKEKRKNRDTQNSLRETIEAKYSEMLRKMEEFQEKAQEEAIKEGERAVETKIAILQDAFDNRCKEWQTKFSHENATISG